MIRKILFMVFAAVAGAMASWATVAEAPGTESDTIIGIDVCRYQGSIDFGSVKDAGIQFVYVKATEGTVHQDRRFDDNVTGAKAAGIPVGAYHFLTNRNSATAQAANFINTVKDYDMDLVPYIDVEVCNQWTAQQLCDSLIVMVDIIEKHFGVKPIIYTSERFYNKFLARSFAGHPMFIAKYSSSQPNSDNLNWIIWQYSDSGKIDGISTNVDMNVLRSGHGLMDIMLSAKQAHRAESSSNKMTKMSNSTNSHFI